MVVVCVKQSMKNLMNHVLRVFFRGGQQPLTAAWLTSHTPTPFVLQPSKRHREVLNEDGLRHTHTHTPAEGERRDVFG